MHAMAFTVMLSLPINPINLHCGLRLGVAGKYYLDQNDCSLSSECFQFSDSPVIVFPLL